MGIVVGSPEMENGVPLARGYIKVPLKRGTLFRSMQNGHEAWSNKSHLQTDICSQPDV